MHTIKAEPISREAYTAFAVYYHTLMTEIYAVEVKLHKIYLHRIRASCTPRVGYSRFAVSEE